MPKYAGLDYGGKRIGIAVSDPGGRIAFPFDTLVREGGDNDLLALRAILQKEGVEILVIGLPRNMDGTLGKSARGVLAFAEALEAVVAIPVRTWDERLTTQEAQRLLISADVSRRKRRSVTDRVAACLILQGFLDWTASHEGEIPPSPFPDPALAPDGQ